MHIARTAHALRARLHAARWRRSRAGSRESDDRNVAVARSARGILALLAVAALAVLGAMGMQRATLHPIQVAAAEPTEYELKAVFLFRFATPYVKWPASAFASKTAPFVVAIVGKDPFGKALDGLLADKQVGEHPIQVVRKATVDELEPCHMLFVPQAQEKHLSRIHELTKDKPTLVVSESISAAQQGAQIGFYLEHSRVRFAINPKAAKQAKLEVSSELLKLAKLVGNQGEEDR